MKEYSSSNLRNVAIVGHGKVGKTSLVESFFYNAGIVNRLGKVDDGTSNLDFETEEIKRKMSTSAVLASCEWEDYKLNFIDTPGYPDFVGEVKAALQAVESALIVLSASAGIEVETEKVWNYVEELNMPRAIFINKMDREHADFYGVVEEMRIKFGAGIVPIQIPIGKEHTFQGVVDLLTMSTKIKVREHVIEQEIPEYMQDEVEKARQKLIETIAEYNNELLEKYLDEQEITEIEVAAALIEGINAGKIFPVLCGSAIKNIGAKKMLNAMIEYMPTPYFKVSIGVNPDTDEIIERKTEDAFSAIVFKTSVDAFIGRISYIKTLSGVLENDMSVLNCNRKKNEKISNIMALHGKIQENLTRAYAGDIVIVSKLQETITGDTLCDKNAMIVYEKIQYPVPMMSMAIKAKNKSDEDKIGNVLSKITDEDQTIKIMKNIETKETIIYGIGELQLDILKEKIKRKFGIEVLLEKAMIPYRETIKSKVKVEGKHKKQSGGHGQYGHVWLEIEPLAPGSGVEFIESIFGGAVPRQYIPAVEKGARETLEGGVYIGYPVVDVKVNFIDGSYHNVDSSEMAFKTASGLAIRKGVAAAKPVLLEPIYNVEITVPEYYMGDVISGLNTKRGRIIGMDSIGKEMCVVNAQVPMAEMFKYATDLRSVSQGRGYFKMEFSHYEEVPEVICRKIIETKNI